MQFIRKLIKKAKKKWRKAVGRPSGDGAEADGYEAPEFFGRATNIPGDRDILTARRAVPAGVIMHQDDRRGTQLKSAPDDFAGVYCGLVDRPFADEFVPDQAIFAVQM